MNLKRIRNEVNDKQYYLNSPPLGRRGMEMVRLINEDTQ